MPACHKRVIALCLALLLSSPALSAELSTLRRNRALNMAANLSLAGAVAASILLVDSRMHPGTGPYAELSDRALAAGAGVGMVGAVVTYRFSLPKMTTVRTSFWDHVRVRPIVRRRMA